MNFVLKLLLAIKKKKKKFIFIFNIYFSDIFYFSDNSIGKYKSIYLFSILTNEKNFY